VNPIPPIRGSQSITKLGESINLNVAPTIIFGALKMSQYPITENSTQFLQQKVFHPFIESINTQVHTVIETPAKEINTLCQLVP
jgi:hypothetical protein